MRRTPLWILLSLCALALPAQERTLHWDALDVVARLDASGVMHVEERHTMVFDGEWNGGERRFNIRSGQKLEFVSLEEIDDSGTKLPMRQGDLAEVGNWAMFDETAIRWRNRSPSDPPFASTRKVYLLTYRISGVVTHRGDKYRLSHDFAFADRSGVIRQFTLDFTMDDAWRPLAPFERTATVTDMEPGSGYVLTIPLSYTGEGKPHVTDLSALVPPPPPPSLLTRFFSGKTPGPVGRIAGFGFLLILGAVAVSFYLADRARGRFRRLVPTASIDRSWLDEHVFSRKPEVVGAAWDEKIGEAEVAALIARLESEGYVRSHVEEKKSALWKRQVLHMKKLRSFNDLPDHERWLLEALFVGKEETDTDRVRKVYKRQGFDPVSGISGNLERARPWKKIREGNTLVHREWIRILIAGGVSILLMVLAVFGGQDDDAVTILLTLLGGGATIAIATPLALFSRRNLAVPHLALLWFLLPLAWATRIFVGNVFFDAPQTLHPLTLVVTAALWTLLVGIVLRAASCEGHEERIAARKTLLAARRWFARELRRKSPQLEDQWIPWLIAFGLGRNIEQWFRAFGGATAAAASSPGSFGSNGMSSGTRSTSTSGWSGGGGAFGGAGASGGWSSAVSAMASGVSAPSSSSGSSSSGGSSSSSSSSSGGSSGGGGGGGW